MSSKQYAGIFKNIDGSDMIDTSIETKPYDNAIHETFNYIYKLDFDVIQMHLRINKLKITRCRD